MKYFRLRQDTRVPHTMVMRLSTIKNYREALAGNVDALAHMSVVFVESSRQTVYPDVADRQLLLVREPVKQVIDLFDPAMTYKNFCMLDNPNDRYEYYFCPVLNQVDCLSEESEFNSGKSRIRKLVIHKEPIQSKNIFQVKGTQEHVIVISLEVAECLLRRKPTAIRLEPVTVR